MTRHTTGTVALLAFGVGIVLGNCGGDSAGDDAKALCMQGCNKTKECLGPIAGSLDCTTSCNQQGGSNGGTQCSNSSEIVAKSKSCLAMSMCEAFIACAQTIPPCAGGPDAGGDGGGPDAGGSSAGCEDCAMADTCLSRTFDAGSSQLAATCAMLSGAQRDQAVAVCKQTLQSLGCQ
jgi:hypothetical protein